MSNKSSNKFQNPTLLPDIPRDIWAARIGTCFNSMTRKLTDKTIAIDPTRLEPKSVMFVDGTGALKLKANSTTDSASEGSFFALDAKIKAGFTLCSASVGFKASTASASAASSQSLNCYCSYTFSGQSLRLLNRAPDILYKYMTDEFQRAYSSVITSTNPTDYFTHYLAFIDKFGHGCVTELYLTSGSAFMINVKYSDKSSSNSHKYGGSICVSTPWGNGGAVAAEFAKDVSKATSHAEMNLIGEHLPQDTPTKEWCNSVMNSVIQAGFAELSEKPALISPPKCEGPTAPVIPEGNPSKEKIPEPSGKIDITDSLKKKIMDEDGFHGTWDDYQKAQKEAYDDLVAEKVVQQTNALLLQANSASSSSTYRHLEKNLKDESNIYESESDPWNLGGYAPFAYTITPWSDLFPELKEVKLPLTFTSLYIAKIYIFYFTRLQFSQYLYFLADVGGKICDNDTIEYDASNFATACNEFLKLIQIVIINNKKFDIKAYSDLVQKFDESVNELDHFNSKEVYRTFFNNYKFFIKNSYGFIPVNEKREKYHSISGDKNVPRPFSLQAMLGDSWRFYPTIRRNGEIVLSIYMYPKASEWMVLDPVVIDIKEKTDDDGFIYYYLSDFAYKRIYGVGFKEIPKGNAPFYVHGMPMLGDLPFTEIKEFAKPKPQV